MPCRGTGEETGETGPAPGPGLTKNSRYIYTIHIASAVFDFLEGVYDIIYDVLNKHPDGFLVLRGDFNMCGPENKDVKTSLSKQ